MKKYSIVKGTETQYSITTTIPTNPPISACVTNYNDNNTMMIVLTDCGGVGKWIVNRDDDVEVRFGLQNQYDPFGTSLSKLIMSYLNGVNTLLLGIGIKETSPEKMKMIANWLKDALKDALNDMKKAQ